MSDRVKCPIHIGRRMSELVYGSYTTTNKRGDHIGWYCALCKKQYDDTGNIIGIVL